MFYNLRQLYINILWVLFYFMGFLSLIYSTILLLSNKEIIIVSRVVEFLPSLKFIFQVGESSIDFVGQFVFFGCGEDRKA